jgi:hypothetical protein
MSTRRVESFLLRIVVPSDEAELPERWRGRIQHVASGEEQQINEIAQAITFMSEHLCPMREFLLEIEHPPQNHHTS